MFKSPDWKHASAYPQAGRASNARYAWEFLRRNTGYRAAWAEYIRTLRDAAGADDVALRVIRWLEAGPEERAATQALRFATVEEWNAARRRLEGLPCALVWEDHADGSRSVTPLGIASAAPWGLESFVSPAQAFSGEIRFAAGKSLRQLIGWPPGELEKMSAAERSDALLRGRWLILQIDLELPIEVVEEIVLRRIRGARSYRTKQGFITPHKTRARRKEWTWYLRILDAREQGVSLARIGEALFPGESNEPPDYTRDKKVRAAERKAIALRDGGYRDLPMLKDTIRRGVKKK